MAAACWLVWVRSQSTRQWSPRCSSCHGKKVDLWALFQIGGSKYGKMVDISALFSNWWIQIWKKKMTSQLFFKLVAQNMNFCVFLICPFQVYCGATCLSSLYSFLQVSSKVDRSWCSAQSCTLSLSRRHISLHFKDSMLYTFTFQTTHLPPLQRPARPWYDPREEAGRVGAQLPTLDSHLQGRGHENRYE